MAVQAINKRLSTKSTLVQTVNSLDIDFSLFHHRETITQSAIEANAMDETANEGAIHPLSLTALFIRRESIAVSIRADERRSVSSAAVTRSKPLSASLQL